MKYRPREAEYERLALGRLLRAGLGCALAGWRGTCCRAAVSAGPAYGPDPSVTPGLFGRFKEL